MQFMIFATIFSDRVWAPGARVRNAQKSGAMKGTLRTISKAIPWSPGFTLDTAQGGKGQFFIQQQAVFSTPLYT